MRLAVVLPALLLLALCFSPQQSGAESVEARLNQFNNIWRQNPVEAFKVLKPVDSPKIVDFIVDIWYKFGNYGFFFEAAIEDALLTTQVGKPLDRLHYHMSNHDKAWMRAHMARISGRLAKPECRTKLLSALKREATSEVIVVIIEALGSFNDPEVVNALMGCLGTGSRPEVRLVAVETLGMFKAASALSTIVEMARKDNIEIRCAAIWSAAMIGGADADKVIIESMGSKDAVIRAAGAKSAAHVKGEEAMKALCALLEDPNWEVVSAAVRSLGMRGEIEAVPAIVNAMQKAKGRLIEDFQNTLEIITKYKFGCDPKNWREWLEESGGKPEVNPKPRPNETPYITFHKVQTRSLNMLFVIDTSGSMNEKVKGTDAAKYLGEGAVLEGDTKLDFVKAELIRTINSLPPEAKFDIITFADDAAYWRGAQAPADDRTKKSAVAHVKALVANGGTNVYGALQLAYGTMKQTTPHYPHDRNPDTIFLLSDGMPTVGDIIDPRQIHDIVTRLNKIRQLVINTIGVGLEGEPFLKPLAEKNAGKYVRIAQ